MVKIDATREAKRIIEAKHYPNVTGTAIGFKVKGGKKTKQVAVIVYVKEKVPSVHLCNKNIIPGIVITSMGDVRTDVIQSGEFKALKSMLEPPLIDFGRPVKPGYSIGHRDITAGTLGLFASRNSKKCLVTNAHVGANTNDGKIGDSLYCPGPYDRGTEEDTIGHLVATVPIEMLLSTCPFAKFITKTLNKLSKWAGRKSRWPAPIAEVSNTVDCCTCELINGLEIDENIPNIGKPMGIVEAILGMKVQKTGRTTAYTAGEITGIEATITVSYGEQGTAIFEDQLVSDIGCDGGDSGSAVLDEQNNLVGLLFAGGSGITIMNRMQTVFDELGLDKID